MNGENGEMGEAAGRAPEEEANSLSLFGAVALGTGVMIGAGIFALTGQVAGLTGDLFPVAFIAAGVVVAFSAYSYVKLSNAFPSSGGIASFLREAYGLGMATGVFSLFMYISMVISESLVARTFGAYLLQIVDLEPASFWVPALGVALLAVAFLVNIAGNRAVQASQGAMAAIKIGGLALFAIVGLWFVNADNFSNGSQGTETFSSGGFLAAVALAILAYKGFTTITNSGGEIIDPHRNTGRAIIISIAISGVLYLAISLTVAGNLTLTEILAAENFALAEAARPAFGDAGLWFTVGLALIATASGVMASVFAASRMLAMLTRMKQVPHRHFGMPGTVRTHAMVYTVAFAMALTILFDLRRIAALGAIFYLIMDVAIHWGILRHLRSRIEVRPAIVVTAIALDVIILAAFLWVKGSEDTLILFASAAGIVLVVVGERLFMRSHTDADGTMHMGDMDM
ncbi:MAG: APC family permease [Acidimicrobiia bacterium]|nr:MAG: APC family permease [Acidimicrobiia bacterium]